MASRKEQKERLRKEREAREAATAEARRRKRLVAYGAGGAFAVAIVAVLVVLLTGGGSGGGGGGGKDGSSGVLPSGGKVPAPKITNLAAAAKAAGCELKSYPGKSRDHTGDLSAKIKYDSNPPTEGRHYAVPADDGAYESSPDVKKLVHALEHGRIIIWFKKSLRAQDRADLKALFDEDTYQMILTPNTTNMPYQVAASAWNGDPQPLGTGRLLGCPKFTPGVFDAIRAFKDEHRGNGPEAVQ